jgi:hypothetical protein
MPSLRFEHMPRVFCTMIGLVVGAPSVSLPTDRLSRKLRANQIIRLPLAPVEVFRTPFHTPVRSNNHAVEAPLNSLPLFHTRK